MSTNQLINVSHVSKNYKEFALKDISFSLEPGYIMGLIGQNGAGKTTVIKLLLNMMPRAEGDIQIFGLDNMTDENKIKQQLAVVFDENYFMESWKVSEVEKAIAPFYEQWNSVAFGEYIIRFGISKDKKVKELSSGMKMKLRLSVALSHNAQLLILDEPTSGIDPVARNELLEVLQEYIEDGKHSVIFSTHITSDLEKIADFITILKAGTVFYSGTKDGLLEAYSFVKGGPNELTAELKSKFIGYDHYGSGFRGLLKTEDISCVPKESVIEPPNIDDILVYLSKGGQIR